MRWDHLFDDLESQLEQELGAQEVDLLAEEERLRLGRLTVRDRIQAMMPVADASRPLHVRLRDGARLSVAIGALGRDWMAGEIMSEGVRASSCVIPLAALAAVLPDPVQVASSTDAPAPAQPGIGSLASRLGLAFVLRDLCRRRASLHITTRGEQLHGTIDRVGRDHLDLAEHEPGIARRQRDVHAVRMLPLPELLLVRF